VPFLHVTSRVKGRKDDSLQSDKSLKFFPTFAFLDPKGGMLASRPGVLNVESMQELASRAAKIRASFLALKAKAEAGDAAAKQRFELRELEFGHVSYADYRKRNPDLSKLAEDVRESVQMVAGEVLLKDAQSTLNSASGDPDKLQAALLEVGTKLLAGAIEGSEPFDDQQRVMFYYYLGAAGEKHGRTDMLDTAIEALVDDAEDNKSLAETLFKWKNLTADLKAKAGAK